MNNSNRRNVSKEKEIVLDVRVPPLCRVYLFLLVIS